MWRSIRRRMSASISFADSGTGSCSWFAATLCERPFMWYPPSTTRPRCRDFSDKAKSRLCQPLTWSPPEFGGQPAIFNLPVGKSRNTTAESAIRLQTHGLVIYTTVEFRHGGSDDEGRGQHPAGRRPHDREATRRELLAGSDAYRDATAHDSEVAETSDFTHVREVPASRAASVAASIAAVAARNPFSVTTTAKPSWSPVVVVSVLYALSSETMPPEVARPLATS